MIAESRHGSFYDGLLPRRLTLHFREVAVAVFFAVVTVVAIVGGSSEVATLVRQYYSNSVALAVSAQMLVGAIIIFALESFFPAQPDVSLLSPAVAIDAIHTFIVRPVTSTALALLGPVLSGFLEQNASWMTLDMTRELPVLVALGIGVIITDFFVWLTHLLKHKIPLLWRFHLMHHAQGRLNMFTADRIHPIEHIQDLVMKFIPLFILFPSLTANWSTTAWLAALYSAQLRFQHSNVRTNLGPLRYLFVTPQSHRVHHSSVKEHWNSNYGSVFAWDRLFGTQHDNPNIYPATGLNDESYPDPANWSMGEMARSLYGQMVYPFRRDAVQRAESAEAFAAGHSG